MKRLFSAILVFSMLLVICPFGAFATEAKTTARFYVSVWNPDNPYGNEGVIYTGENTNNGWWGQASFKPIDGGNGWEVVEVSNPIAEGYCVTPIDMPEDGFVWAIYPWSDYNADCFEFLVALEPGEQYTIDGLDFANMTCADNATIAPYVADEPEEPDVPNEHGKTWKDNQTLDDDGDYIFDNAYGFVFKLDGVDGCIRGEDTYIITNADAYSTCNPNWAISVPLKATETEGVYSVMGVIACPGSVAGAGINWLETDLVLVTHSTYSNPNSTNYEAKCAAVALTEGTLVKYEGSKVIVQNEYGSFAESPDEPVELVYSGSCGENVTWLFDPETGIITISGEGEMMDGINGDFWGYQYYEKTPWEHLTDDIIYVIIEPGVTALAGWSFHNCTNLEATVLPEGLTDIGVGAFDGCTSLKSITLPKSITRIGAWALQSVEKIYISDLKAFCEIELWHDATVMWDAEIYLNGEPITDLVIPEGVTALSGYIFYGCDSITSVTVPDSMTEIGMFAFSGCTNLKSIHLSKGIASIDGSFDGCDSLEEITVDDNNPIYYSSGNCLIERETETLVLGCKNSIIPNGVASICAWSFVGCSNMTSITIPESVTSIGWCAFLRCSNLTTVIYSGTQEDWENIDIENDNDALIEAYYNSKCDHSWNETIVVAPTCAVEGLIEKDCEMCGVHKTVVEPTNENHTWNEGNVLLAPTCSQKGLVKYTCTECGKTKNSTLDKIPHIHNWTVLDDGTKIDKCSVCGEIVETLGADEFIPNDINGDNKFDVFDYVAVKNCVIKGTKDEELKKRADVNGDGKLNIFDYAAIKAAYFAK